MKPVDFVEFVLRFQSCFF